MVITLTQARSQFSQLIERAHQGEEIVITRRRVPVARLEAVNPKPKGRRQAGTLAGQIVLVDAFFEPLPDDELAVWNGE